MPTIAEALEVLAPNAVTLVDYIVADDGVTPGLRIVYWSPTLGAQPTAEQLSAVTDAQVQATRDAKEPDLTTAFLDRADQMVADLDTYIALASPTNAQLQRQVKDLSQNQRRLIRATARLVRRSGVQ